MKQIFDNKISVSQPKRKSIYQEKWEKLQTAHLKLQLEHLELQQNFIELQSQHLDFQQRFIIKQQKNLIKKNCQQNITKLS